MDKALIIKAPGSNCDHETAEALRLAGIRPETLHLYELERHPARIQNYNLIVLPGGFSYGDYLGSGKAFARFVETAFGDQLQEFVHQGGWVLGICNGFQALLHLGLLPSKGHECSLTINRSGSFECRWVRLKVEKNSVFAKKIAKRFLLEGELPVANGEGRFVTASSKVTSHLLRQGLAFLTYQNNYNDSEASIAGITNARGNVIGLMPHPERFFKSQHHYAWPNRKNEPPWGLQFLKSIVERL